ncbi:hypothetical protein EIP86_007367 [Pleurotus ostreatoroseus]|nr:hypothetical protein EIP86_007367 [Pleurotus ostreatoroseus]
MSQIRKRPLASREDTAEGPVPTPPVPVHTNLAGFDAFDDSMNLRVFDRLFVLYHSNPDADIIVEEEDEIRGAENHDLSIFKNIDSSFLDDSLLSNMREALKLRPRSSNDTLRFVLAIFRGRLGSYLPEQPSINKVAWPWTLSHSTRTMLCDILADSLYHELLFNPHLDWKALSEQDSEWSGSFIFIICLVPPRESIPSSVGSLLQAIVKYSRENEGWSPMDVFSYQIRAVTRHHHDWPVRSMLFLFQSLKTLEAEVAEKCLQYIAHTTFVAHTGPVHKIYDYLLTELEHPFTHANDIVAPTPEILGVLLELGGIILHKYTAEQAQNQEKLTTLSSSMRDLLNFVLTAVSKSQNILPNFTLRTPLTSVSSGTELASVLADLFVTPRMTFPLLSFFITRSHFLVPLDTVHGSNSFPELVRRVRRSHGECLLVLSACTSFFEDKKTLLQRLARTVLLRLAYLAYMLPTDVDADSITHWRRMFSAIIACIEKDESGGPRAHTSLCQEQHDSTCEAAFAILHEIHNCDDHHEPEEGNVESFIAQSQVPDEMVEEDTGFIHTIYDEQTEKPLHSPLSRASPSSNVAGVVPIPTGSDPVSTSKGVDGTTAVVM